MNAETYSGYASLVDALPPGALLAFQNVDWQDYENLIHQFDERPGIRLTYDCGRLEVMTLSPEHERIAGLFPALMLVLAEESGLEYLSQKSTAFRRRDRTRGLEPDDCFYFRHFRKIARKKTLDMSIDPPPDLAIEVDVASACIDKLPLYADMRVPELWRYVGGRIEFYALAGSHYVAIRHSKIFPFLTPSAVLRFLHKGAAQGTVTMVRAFRAWVRSRKLGKHEG